MSEFTDAAIGRYVDQDPKRRKEYALDPAAHMRVELLRQTLDAVERAMTYEDVPEEVRRRVTNRVVWGDPEGVDDRHARVRLDREELLGAYDLLLSLAGPLGPIHDESAGPVRPDEEPTT